MLTSHAHTPRTPVSGKMNIVATKTVQLFQMRGWLTESVAADVHHPIIGSNCNASNLGLRRPTLKIIRIRRRETRQSQLRVINLLCMVAFDGATQVDITLYEQKFDMGKIYSLVVTHSLLQTTRVPERKKAIWATRLV